MTDFPKYRKAQDTLSFMRMATKAERKAGSMPIRYWSIEPSGNYSADVNRGKAAAEELMAFLLAAPTNGNLTLPSMILVDMLRVLPPKQVGLLIGFGSVLGKFAFIGATVAGSDAIRRDEDNRRRELIAGLREDGRHDIADSFEAGKPT